MTEAGFRLLHVGCGHKTQRDISPPFNQAPWRECRLDIDAAVEPDILSSITDMQGVETGSFDAIWSAHNVEHLFPHEVELALAEFVRVLTPAGFAVVTVPDLEPIAQAIISGRLLEPAYTAPAGPIAAIDILFGFRPSLAAGNHYMAHRTGFTAASLELALRQAGFLSVAVRRDGFWSLWAVASRSTADQAGADYLAALLARSADPNATPSTPETKG